MRLVDKDLCLTVSTGIKPEAMLDILGRQEALPEPQVFGDPSWRVHHLPGRSGLLNVFEEGEFLVTLEANGFLGVTRRTINKIRDMGGLSHYAAICHFSAGGGTYQYVEVQDGIIIANFDPQTEEAPESVADFFTIGDHPDNNRKTMEDMIKAVEYRMEISVREKWLDTPTATYLIDYRTDFR